MGVEEFPRDSSLSGPQNARAAAAGFANPERRHTSIPRTASTTRRHPGELSVRGSSHEQRLAPTRRDEAAFGGSCRP
jgi:hypothetical protein